MPGVLFRLFSALSGSLVGLIVLELHCPITQPAHLLLGHAPLTVVLAALLAGVSWARCRVSAGSQR